MSCHHHPTYDPASGESIGTVRIATVHAQGKFPTYKKVPCPYCWKARAEWLDMVAQGLALDSKRIKELEADGERLDWLEAEGGWQDTDCFAVALEESWYYKDLRQAIDKARKGAK